MSVWEVVLNFLYGLLGYHKVTATSVLKTKGGTPVSNASVTLSYARTPGSWVQDGKGLSNATGTVKDSVYLKRGTYIFKMSFAGGGGYGPSSAQKSATV